MSHRTYQDRMVVVTEKSRRRAAVALVRARRGAGVGLLARSAEQLSPVADRAKAFGTVATTQTVEPSDGAAAKDATRAFRDHWDRIDVLVNAAGIKRSGSIDRVSAHEAVTALGVNCCGALACCQATIPGMRWWELHLLAG